MDNKFIGSMLGFDNNTRFIIDTFSGYWLLKVIHTHQGIDSLVYIRAFDAAPSIEDVGNLAPEISRIYNYLAMMSSQNG